MFTPDVTHLLTVARSIPWRPFPVHPLVVAYLGPNTVLPLASALAAGIGVILMFGRYIAATVRKIFKTASRRDVDAVESETSDQAPR